MAFFLYRSVSERELAKGWSHERVRSKQARVWLTGAAGTLGGAFTAGLEGHGIEVIATGRDLDVRDRDGIRAFAARERPTHVINCAAYTSVDDAETNETEAFAVNATGAQNVAGAAREIGAGFVHFSTDYVFAGRERRPLGEDHPCEPLNVYGRTKREGELRVLAVAAARDARSRAISSWVIRTSWLWAAHGDGWVNRVVRWLREDTPLRAIADQLSRPTYAPDLVEATLALTGLLPVAGAADRVARSGIHHFANSGEASWHMLTVEVVRQARRAGLITVSPTVEAIRAEDLRRRATRPSYSVLSTRKIEAALGRAPRTWQAALNEFMAGITRG